MDSNSRYAGTVHPVSAALVPLGCLGRVRVAAPPQWRIACLNAFGNYGKESGARSDLFFGTPLRREELRGDDSCSSSFDRHYLVVGALPGIGGTQLIDDHKVTRTSLSQEQTHPTGTAGVLGKVISAGLKQALPDEPPLRNT